MIDNDILTRAKNIYNDSATVGVKSWTLIEIAHFIEQWDEVTAKLRKYCKKRG